MPRLLRLTRTPFDLWVGAVVLALAASGPAGIAHAHAYVAHSAPAAGSLVETSPLRVRVWFSEPVEGAGSELSVLDAQGAPVDRHDGAQEGADPTQLSVSLPAALPDGVYTVRWKAVTGDDDARTSGEFQFGVGEAVVPPAPATSVPWAGVDARVSIEEPRDGARVEGPDVPLAIHLQGVTSIAMGSSSVPRPGTLGGHLHVSADGTMIGMVSTGKGLVVHNLANGPHEIVVALSAPDHLPYAPPIESRVRITVAGSTATGAVTLTDDGAQNVPRPPPSAVTALAARLPSWPVTAGLLLAILLVLGVLAGKLTSRPVPPGERRDG